MQPRRAIPSVDRLLGTAGGAELVRRYRRERVVEAIRAVLDAVRRADGPVPEPGELVGRAGARLESASVPRLGPVVNATGVILHTNLGRAVLAEEAIAAVAEAARRAVNL